MTFRRALFVTFALAVGALGLLGHPPAQGANPPNQALVDALTRAHAAVVGVQVTASEGARSAETLGRERSGSGVVIGPDGLILTIGYLMMEADTIQVVTQDKRTLPARSVGYDQATGFGLVQALLPLRGVTPVPLGSIAGTNPGDPLMVSVGGEDADVSMTQVVSKRAFSGYWEYHIEQALFTSPPVANHSGAAVFNQRGELLGIGSLYVGDASGEQRRMPGNMFVPVDLLKPILSELRSTGTTAISHRPWLGVSSTEQGGRIQIVRVNRGGPAASSGLMPGDVVLAVDGVRVSTLEGFYKQLWSRPDAEREVELIVLQGAEIRKIVVRSVDRLMTLKKPSGI